MNLYLYIRRNLSENIISNYVATKIKQTNLKKWRSK